MKARWHSPASDVQAPDADVEPVVVIKALSTRQAKPAVVQLRHVDDTGFELRLQPWDERDSIPAPETIGYLVIER